jgi:DNA invertase Pin-like site-specific DNA recombinase
MLDGIQSIQRVAARGAPVKVLDKPYLDLTSARGILAFLSALAQDERERIVKEAQGVQFGPKPELTQHRRQKGADGSRTVDPPGRLPETSIAIMPPLRLRAA